MTGVCPKNHVFPQKCLQVPPFPKMSPPKSTMSEGKSIQPQMGQTFYPLLFFFVSVLLLQSFLKSYFLIQFFYNHDVIRSDTKDVFFVQYLVGYGIKSRIISGFSLSCPDFAGGLQGCQSTIPIKKKNLQKQRRDLASVTIKSHITRSLFLLLYLFSKIVFVSRKRVRNQAGGHLCQRAKQFILIWGKTSILSYHQMCFFFSCICVRSSLNSFLKSTFLIFSFYDHDVNRSNTQDVFFVQYLVGFGHKSRINTGGSWCPSKVYWVFTRCAKYFIKLKKALLETKKGPCIVSSLLTLQGLFFYFFIFFLR